MIKKYKHPLFGHFDNWAIFFICLLLYYFLVYELKTDINTHIEQIVRINKGWTNYPPNFLFYFMVNLLAGFSGAKVIYPVTVLVLSIATTAKYAISKKIIQELNHENIKNNSFVSPKIITLFTIGLLLCFAILDPYSLFVIKKIYITKFVPHVWHNSTIIALFPFALLLFWKQLKLFDVEKSLALNDILLVNVLVLINLLIKPSFIFAYAPITFIYFLVNFKRRVSIKDYFLRLTPFIIILIVVAIQYYLIYTQQEGSFFNEESSIILTSPFKMMAHFVPYYFIPFSIFLSFLLPIVTYLSYNEIVHYKPFKYALYLTIFAILISTFIMEQGPRATHGNFLWQNIICTYLLFLSTISFIINNISSKSSLSKKDKFILIILALHVISGILYLLKILYTQSYY